MAKTTHDTWNPRCLDAPMFAPLQRFAPYIRARSAWPSLNDYQTLLDSDLEPIRTQHNMPLRITPQSEKPTQLCEHYEPRIYLRGELQTRYENWHDFFQILVWRTFPKSKSALNACHYHAASQRLHTNSKNTNRSPLENAATLFDECGVILLSSDPFLLQLVREHRWHELFWTHRSALTKQFCCIIFGHALYEKALTPYIGMTAHSIMLQTSEAVLTLTTDELCAYCDEQIAQMFDSGEHRITSPKDLTPFPLLGMPGWHPDNHQRGFYENERYFRARQSG